MYIKDKNKFIKYDNFSIMEVQYKDKWYSVYIDTEEVGNISTRHWRASHKKQKIYIVSGSKSKNNTVYLHNFLLNYKSCDGYEVDHIDGNSLNNRKENLRIVTRKENIQNTKARIDNTIGIRGVCKNPWNSYKVDFSFDKNRYYFQNWKTIEEAVYCRKVAENYFGLKMLDNNPLSYKYDTLSQKRKEEIKKIVIENITKVTV